MVLFCAFNSEKIFLGRFAAPLQASVCYMQIVVNELMFFFFDTLHVWSLKVQCVGFTDPQECSCR